MKHGRDPKGRFVRASTLFRRRVAPAVLAVIALGGLLVPAAATAAEPADPAQGASTVVDNKAASQDPKFTFAVMPDTQQEVLDADDTRFVDRTRWLVDNRARLDLRFALHVGDITNWGWLDQPQYDVASEAMRPLEQAGIPFTIAAGNHDTRAVGWNGAGEYGGDAYVKNPECLERFPAAECDTKLLVRHTEEFNAAFPVNRIADVGGTFEAGKSENLFTTYEAGRKDWLVLTLELWPRPEVVEWAKDVVATHPDHNVIVLTHSYLTSSGGIKQDNGGYSSTSGQFLFDNLIKLYPNIKMVFSGHEGSAAQRTDVGVNGNVIHSFLNCFHSNTTNPVRLVEVDTVNDTLRTWIEAPYTGETLDQFTVSLTGVDWD